MSDGSNIDSGVDLSIKVIKHSYFEDAQALIIATLLIALGVTLFNRVGLLSGGTAGLAFLLHYATGYSFGLIFFVINLPFYYISWKKMGHEFTLKTFCAVALLSLWSWLIPRWLAVADVQPLFAAIMGGLLLGTGFLILIRHKACLGGTGIVALYLQQSRGWRAGKIQMGVDICIVALALLVATPKLVLFSILGSVAMNMVLAVNHRQGRYVGM